MASNIKGITVEIAGDTTNLQRALSDVNTASRNLTGELKEVDKLLKLDPGNVTLLKQKQDLLSESITNTSEKLRRLQEAEADVQRQFENGDIAEEQYRAFQRELEKTRSELNTLETAAEANSTVIENLGNESEEAADDADKLGDELDNSGKQADEASGKFDALVGVLKGVGAVMGAAFAAVGAAAVAGTKALTDMAVGTAAYADDMLTMSTVTGMSTDSLQAYSYAADLVDVSMETVTKTMAKNIKSMDAARDAIVSGKGETNAMAQAYAALGVSVVDNNGKLRDSEKVYWEAIDALGTMEEGAERDALAMQVFGKSAQDLNPLIATGSAGIAELTEEARNMGAVMSESQLAMAGAFDDTIQRLTQGSSAAKNALGTILMPQLTVLGTVGADLLGQFSSAILSADGDMEKMSEAVSDVVANALTAINDILPGIVDTAMSIVSAIAGAISANLSMLIDTATSIVMTILDALISALPAVTEGALQLVLTLVNGILQNLPQIVQAALTMIVTLAAGIAESLPTLIPTIVNCVVFIVQTLIENLPMILDAALQLILGLAQGILTALPQLIAALPAIILAIVDFILGAIPEIIQAGIELLTSLIGALPEIIVAIVEAIPQIIEGIITAVLGAIPLIIQAGIDLLISLIKALPQIITAIVAAIPQIISGLLNALLGSIPQIIAMGIELFVSLIKNLPTIIVEILRAVPQIITALVGGFTDSIGQIVEVGSNIVKGLWDGIKAMGDWIKSKVSDFFGGIVSGVKGLLGIHSPSKVFAGIGDNMALGLGEGFEDAMSDVRKDIQKSVPTDFDVTTNLTNTMSGLNSVSNADILGTSEMGGGSDIISMIVTRLDMMTELLSGILGVSGHDIYLDNGVLVGELAPQMDTSLGDLQLMKGR